MIKSKSQLVTSISRDLSDNSTGQISPYDIRQSLLDVVDSIHLLTADSNLLSNNFSTPDTRTTRVGELSLDKLLLDGYTSVDNTSVGYGSLKANYKSSKNTAIGSYAMSCNIDGINNVAVGYSSLAGNTAGYSNVGVGNFSLNYNKTGDFNIAIGHGAGYYAEKASNNKLYIASHPVDETYTCDNPTGNGLVPLVYGDLSEIKFGIGTKSLHPYGTLQVSGAMSPSANKTFDIGHAQYIWNDIYVKKIVADTTDNEVKIAGNLVPDGTREIGASGNKFNKGWFQNISADYVTAIQQTHYLSKTINLASSGDFSTVDGGNAVSVNGNFPCPDESSFTSYLSDQDLVGAGLIAKSSVGDYHFKFGYETDSCGSKFWESNIGIQVNSIYAPDDPLHCNGVHFSGDLIFLSDRSIYDNRSTIQGLGHCNFIANSGLDPRPSGYANTFGSTESGVNIIQNFLNGMGGKNVDENDKENLCGFSLTYFDESNSDYNYAYNADKFVIGSYDNTSYSINHITLMKSDERGGVFGINNFDIRGELLTPETIFNVRSKTDAVARITAENTGPVKSSVELLGSGNCEDFGASLSYRNTSGIFDINLYDQKIDKNFMRFYASGDSIGIQNSGLMCNDALSIGMEGKTNSSIAMFNTSDPTNTASYGKIFVKTKVTSGQEHSLYFMDGSGNVFNTILNAKDGNDGLLYCYNGNTFGGVESPDVRGDTPNASNNTAYGFRSLNKITNGGANVSIGANAGYGITTGSKNISIGYGSMSGCVEEISSNIITGCDFVGSGLTTSYNYMVGLNNRNLIMQGKLGPTNSQKFLRFPSGKLYIDNDDSSKSLYIDSKTIQLQDNSGSDLPEDKLSFNMLGGNGGGEVFALDHKAQKLIKQGNYAVAEPPRPFAEISGDLRLLGAVRFSDGSSLESAKTVTEASEAFKDIFVEGFALSDITYAGGIESPATGFIKARDGRQFNIVNRDRHTLIKNGDYIIAIKMNNEYRPIWISNESSVCTCCGK